VLAGAALVATWVRVWVRVRVRVRVRVGVSVRVRLQVRAALVNTCACDECHKGWVSCCCGGVVWCGYVVAALRGWSWPSCFEGLVMAKLL